MPFDEGTGSRRAKRARRRAGVRKPTPKSTVTPRADTGADKSRVAVQGRARAAFEKVEAGGGPDAKQKLAIIAKSLTDVEKRDLGGYSKVVSERNQEARFKDLNVRAARGADEIISATTGFRPSDAIWAATHPVDRVTNRTHRGQRQVTEGTYKGAWEAESPDMAAGLVGPVGRIGSGLSRVVLKGGKKAPDPKDIEKYLDEQEVLDPNEAFAGFAAPKEIVEETGKETSKFGEIINIPRAIRASFDISAPFRQGLVLGARHPVMFARNWKPMIEALKSEGAHMAHMQQIYDRPTFDLMKGRLALTDIDHKLGPREENLIGMAYAERLRGVGGGIRASGRAYVTFLNKFRADAFDNYLMMAKRQGRDVSGTTKESKKLLDDIAEVVNTATGRGNLKKVQGEMPLLNGLLFSPRLMLSRFQLLNPHYYYKLDKFAQRQALKQAGATIGEVAFALKMAEMAGADVGLDPRSSDFGKIKIGDTRIDIMGGLQQYVVLYSRLITRQTVNEHGEVTDLLGGYAGRSPYDVGLGFLENKTAPVPGTVIDYFKGEEGVGEPFTAKTIAKQLVPIGLENTIEAGMEGGPGVAGATLGLGAIGFGVDTYEKSSKGMPRTAQARMEAKVTKDMKSVRRLAKIRGYEGVPQNVSDAIKLRAAVEARLKVLTKDQKKAKNAQVPEGKKLKLSPKQRYAAVIDAFRDNVPGFDYESAKAQLDGFTPEALDDYQKWLRSVYYSDLLQDWSPSAKY